MKTSLTGLLVFAIMVAGSCKAKADNKNFPNLREVYDVTTTETARQGKEQTCL